MEAAKGLRAQNFKGLIIGVTGNALDDDVAEFLNAGADIVFSKPLKIDSINSLLCYIEEHGCASSGDHKLFIVGNTIQKSELHNSADTGEEDTAPATRKRHGLSSTFANTYKSSYKAVNNSPSISFLSGFDLSVKV